MGTVDIEFHYPREARIISEIEDSKQITDEYFYVVYTEDIETGLGTGEALYISLESALNACATRNKASCWYQVSWVAKRVKRQDGTWIDLYESKLLKLNTYSSLGIWIMYFGFVFFGLANFIGMITSLSVFLEFRNPVSLLLSVGSFTGGLSLFKLASDFLDRRITKSSHQR